MTDQRTNEPITDSTAGTVQSLGDLQRTIETTETRAGGETEKMLAEKGLQNELERITSASSGRVSVAVAGLSGERRGLRAGVNEDEVFRSASMIKVLILFELLREVDAGRISLGEPLGTYTVESAAMSMITVSDNDATNLIVERIGFDAVNDLGEELGLTNTVLQRAMLDYGAIAEGRENYTSASDMALLFEQIWNRELLSPASRRFALTALEAQQLNSKIPSGVPQGTRVLHKTGELDGIEHDGGIIIAPSGSVVLVVLTEGDVYENTQTISQISSAVYTAFS